MVTFLASSSLHPESAASEAFDDCLNHDIPAYSRFFMEIGNRPIERPLILIDGDDPADRNLSRKQCKKK